LPAFFKEVDRVLCPGGVLAVSGFYNNVLVHPTKSEEFQKAVTKVNILLFTITGFRISKTFDEFIKQLSDHHLGTYWGTGIKHLANEYADIHLPYKDTVRFESLFFKWFFNHRQLRLTFFT